ncbi:MAG: hypothetical protein RBS08_04845 [Bdellovibrionales bacterium]|jgi:hypothetical protein|nr:hypothetical protein [Bdellovibrionales bacterium]
MSLSASFASALVPALIGASVIAGGIGWSDTKGAQKALDEAGYTEVQVGKAGRGNTHCKGFYRNSFSAVTAKGEKVAGTVCQSPGNFKKAEISTAQPVSARRQDDVIPVFIAFQ